MQEGPKKRGHKEKGENLEDVKSISRKESYFLEIKKKEIIHIEVTRKTEINESYKRFCFCFLWF